MSGRVRGREVPYETCRAVGRVFDIKQFLWKIIVWEDQSCCRAIPGLSYPRRDGPWVAERGEHDDGDGESSSDNLRLRNLYKLLTRITGDVLSNIYIKDP